MQHPAMSPPLFTADLPGVGGRIRARDEDFEVEEVPSYEPSGSGDHLYLWVEKKGVAPEFFAQTIARKLGTHPGNVGTAGLKDRHAVTRQWVSVPRECEPRVGKLDGDGVRVLKTGLHANKLKPGHLRGNKFTILIRDADRSAPADAILDRIRTQGLPNYYGPQRFGRDGGTVDLGFQCLAGKAPRRIRPFLFRFALSAVQSLLFNDYLSRRMKDGLFRTVLDGDVMTKWPFGGMFVAQDVPAEQARFDARETVTAGPMFGKKTFPGAGVAAEREAVVLSDNKLSVASFAGFGKLVMGTRRQNIVYLDDLTSAWEADGLRLSFTLPAGSYATVLLAEVMKANIAEDGDASDGADEDEQ
ncbi:tRNA pseudouridine synthase D [Gemmata obscuriglobus]|nr:tRNA pseudouridine(13) synthase TruD [Gemmata obscuriglobus]QEG31853.1 tRNA pseudouridine synthase D [Gemmata obscuriglobus]VTS11199.1 trna pseudouridine synthase d : tRNA pseudouridine synthase D OS=Planctomyces maris DSM 8797 GN=truD PE=3 SV=1: TruD [Gemmata obscuriglobus UQM 2246]